MKPALIEQFILPNLQPDDRRYDESFFIRLLDKLQSSNNELFRQIGPGVVVAISCALGRSDIVPLLLESLLPEGGDDSQAFKIYLGIRETITAIWQFVGAPQVVPAVVGSTFVLRERGVKSELWTRGAIEPHDTLEGERVRSDIYKASGNSDVFNLQKTYFGDFAYGFETFTFGYNIGRTPDAIFALQDLELCIMASVVGLGPTRQARNHVLACFGFGHGVKEVQAVLDVACELATWARQPFPIDYYLTEQLWEQARRNIHDVS